MIAMRNVQEANLAWALVEAAKPHLADRERTRVFVAVGAGDTYAVIRTLLKIVAAKRIPLRADLVQRCTAWLDTYALHEEQQYLRRLMEGYLTPDSTTDSNTVRVNDALTTPKRLGLVYVRERSVS
jgi:hypothetical protein